MFTSTKQETDGRSRCGGDECSALLFEYGRSSKYSTGIPCERVVRAIHARDYHGASQMKLAATLVATVLKLGASMVGKRDRQDP
jgi:hypothetical protein